MADAPNPLVVPAADGIFPAENVTPLKTSVAKQRLNTNRKVTPVATMSSTMDRSCEWIRIRPHIARIVDLCDAVIAIMPERGFGGFERNQFRDSLLYATLYSLEQQVDATTKSDLTAFLNYATPHQAFLLPDLVARAVESFVPLVPNKSDLDRHPTIEISRSFLYGEIDLICQENDLPIIHGAGRWDATLLERWTYITSALANKDFLSLRLIDAKPMHNRCILGAGILIRAPTDDARDLALADGNVTVVGHRMSAFNESLIAFLKPAFYYKLGDGVYMPYLSAAEGRAVLALSGYYSGLRRPHSEIMNVLFSCVRH
jgi:hypothetical protein